MTLTDYLISNWPIIVVAISAVVVATVYVLKFSDKPKEEQIKAFREWLLFAVVEAEKALGGGTGKLKLRFVYDMFLKEFPYLASFILFDQFSEYVDIALEEMRKMLESNENAKHYVEGD